MNAFLILATLIASALGDSHVPPTICMSSPAIPLKPGSVVSARIESPGGKRCEATLTFSNPDFFPLRFDLRQLNCMGPQIAEFIVPPEVPNGDAYILFRCADQPSPVCTKAIIADGLSDANAINFSQSGSINCIFPISTFTTFTTIIGPSTTLIEPIVTTAFSTGTPAIATPAVGSASLIGSGTPGRLVPVGVTTLFSTLTDGSKILTTAIISTLFSAAITETPKPTPFTTLIPVATETITSFSTGVSETIAITFISTVLSAVVSERLTGEEGLKPSYSVAPTHSC